MLTLLALTAATTVVSGSRVQVEVRATVTIQRGITLQNGTATTPSVEVVPVRQKPRDCGPVDQPMPARAPDCRLIVYDLP